MIADLKEWLGLVAIAISVGGAFYAWVTSRASKNSLEIAKIDKRQIEYDRRIQKLEDEFKHLPTREMISEIRVAIAQINAVVDSTNRGVSRLEEDFRAMNNKG